MFVRKRALLAAAACSVVIALSTAAIAQTKKSTEATSLNEGDAIMLHPSTAVHKSNTKITAAQHEAAMKKGAREVKPGAVIYRQQGKLYMLEDNANEKASENFQSNFEVSY
jgi:hypothetical protein